MDVGKCGEYDGDFDFGAVDDVGYKVGKGSVF